MYSVIYGVVMNSPNYKIFLSAPTLWWLKGENMDQVLVRIFDIMVDMLESKRNSPESAVQDDDEDDISFDIDTPIRTRCLEVTYTPPRLSLLTVNWDIRQMMSDSMW